MIIGQFIEALTASLKNNGKIGVLAETQLNTNRCRERGDIKMLEHQGSIYGASINATDAS